jgi:hypothetical protein
MVSFLQPRDIGTHRNNDPSALMTTDDREKTHPHGRQRFRGRHHISCHQMLVAMAQTCDFPLNDYFAGLGRIDVNLINRPLLMETPKHTCTRLHDGKRKPSD